MTIRQLGEICEERKIDCENCQYKNYCYEILPQELEDISPAGLLKILDTEVKGNDYCGDDAGGHD